jgi:hypothetical protein
MEDTERTGGSRQRLVVRLGEIEGRDLMAKGSYRGPCTFSTPNLKTARTELERWPLAGEQ